MSAANWVFCTSDLLENWSAETFKTKAECVEAAVGKGGLLGLQEVFVARRVAATRDVPWGLAEITTVQVNPL